MCSVRSVVCSVQCGVCSVKFVMCVVCNVQRKCKPQLHLRENPSDGLWWRMFMCLFFGRRRGGGIRNWKFRNLNWKYRIQNVSVTSVTRLTQVLSYAAALLSRSALACEHAIIRKRTDLVTRFSGRIWSQGACWKLSGAVTANAFFNLLREGWFSFSAFRPSGNLCGFHL